jgi:hypothetical protein
MEKQITSDLTTGSVTTIGDLTSAFDRSLRMCAETDCDNPPTVEILCDGKDSPIQVCNRHLLQHMGSCYAKHFVMNLKGENRQTRIKDLVTGNPMKVPVEIIHWDS